MRSIRIVGIASALLVAFSTLPVFASGSLAPSQAAGATSEQGPSSYVSLAESYRGSTAETETQVTNATISGTASTSTSPNQALSTSTIQVTDTKGTYELSTQPIPNEQTGTLVVLTDFSGSTQTVWLANDPTSVVSGPTTTPLKETQIKFSSQQNTPSTSGPSPQQVIILNLCELGSGLPYLEDYEGTEFLFAETGIDCTYDAQIDLASFLQQVGLDLQWHDVGLAGSADGYTTFLLATGFGFCIPPSPGEGPWPFRTEGGAIVVWDGMTAGGIDDSPGINESCHNLIP